ncbi:uncharacterized protein V6R79_005182 [Siganus canaliculatus]
MSGNPWETPSTSPLMAGSPVNSWRQTPRFPRPLFAPMTLIVVDSTIRGARFITEVTSLISKSKPTCHLDPLPSPLVKACLPSLTPLITTTIHSSLSCVTMQVPSLDT